jgi:hypothetical protein
VGTQSTPSEYSEHPGTCLCKCPREQRSVSRYGFEDRADVCGHFAVESRRWLVEEDHRRVCDELDGDREPLQPKYLSSPRPVQSAAAFSKPTRAAAGRTQPLSRAVLCRGVPWRRHRFSPRPTEHCCRAVTGQRSLTLLCSGLLRETTADRADRLCGSIPSMLEPMFTMRIMCIMVGLCGPIPSRRKPFESIRKASEDPIRLPDRIARAGGSSTPGVLTSGR